MFRGQLVAIFLAPAHGKEPHAVESAEAIAGRGLMGDRHFLPAGKDKPADEITLIEAESLEALPREYQMELRPEQARRNLLTRGVPLNHLVGKEFTVGPVRLRGIELCEPCGHLEKLTAKRVIKGLRHRGGLRAQIVQGGTLRVGDTVAPADVAPE